MMNKIFLVIFFFFVSLGLVNASEGERELLLVYTGDVIGYVEGCG